MMNLQLFAGSLTVTVYKDAGMTTASASPSSALAENDQVTLTLTPASGKEVDQIIVLSGGVTVNKETKKFNMGESNVVLAVTSKANNLYKVVENCFVSINGTKTEFTKNMVVEVGKTGAVVGVKCDGTAITLNDGVQNLIDQGILIKI